MKKLKPLRMAQVEINVINCFSVQIPVEAFGIKENAVVEIVVEYGQSANDDSKLFAKVWARKPYNILSGYIYGTYLKYIKDEAPLDSATRICDELNKSDQFITALVTFWKSTLRGLPEI